MNNTNPYEAPDATLHTNDSSENSQQIERVASGQKMIIYAILFNILAVVLQLFIHPTLGLLALIGLIISIIGTIKLATGLGQSIGLKVLYIILMFIPFISLITLLILNSKATKTLRNAGYKVGLLGASK